MSGCRNIEELRKQFKNRLPVCPEEQEDFYNDWAKNYDQDVLTLNYRAPKLAVDFISSNFCGNRGDAQVLDVACGSGLVAKHMFQAGFRHFVGVDISSGMLSEASRTGLYRDLRRASLGPEPLPVNTGVFDVVVTVGALNAGFISVSAIRELCRAAKPGALLCLVRGHHYTDHPLEQQYNTELIAELQLMEDAGLWTQLVSRQVDRYMIDTEADQSESQAERYISGSVYLFRKTI
ncbi:methyltransferase-like protein 27 [Gouania willdenowi]|uniref:Methyltransferase-like protein 27 n=1 Tax=Gouania willdenowi TaxID=441366 RepID=A0A8C5EHE2_GOUWI|nr:methyltransferase-like protein 27 [Gouania willdenowi]